MLEVIMNRLLNNHIEYLITTIIPLLLRNEYSLYCGHSVKIQCKTHFGSIGTSLLSLQTAAKRAIVACSGLKSPWIACWCSKVCAALHNSPSHSPRSPSEPIDVVAVSISWASSTPNSRSCWRTLKTKLM